MAKEKLKQGALFCLWAVLCAVSLYKSVPIWILFALLAGHQLFTMFRPRKAAGLEQGGEPSLVEFGVLGRHQIDGPGEEASFGMFIDIAGAAVFLDIREDDLLDDRISQARLLEVSADDLALSLSAFLQRNTEYRGRRVASIGLHARDVERGEVFWKPDGYSLLKGKIFQDP